MFGACPNKGQPRPEKDDCRQNLKCWARKHYVEAAVRCKFQIENAALYDYEWTSGVLELDFPRQVWKDKGAGICVVWWRVHQVPKWVRSVAAYVLLVRLRPNHGKCNTEDANARQRASL